MVKTGIIGATGYTGLELVRIILQHPELDLVYLAADSTAGRPYAEVYPHMINEVVLTPSKYSLEDIRSLQLDVVFVALPHGQSMVMVPELLSAGIRVIDLGADFRLRDKGAYPQWYKVEHTAPELLAQAVYGLPEKYREKVKTAQLVANPGCYPTATILGLWPLVANGVRISNVFVDAKSGVSGAGKKLTDATHFPNCNDAVSAYKVLTHQHTPEMIQESESDLSFVPSLIPMTRGILSTICVHTETGYAASDIRQLLQEQYKNDQFVNVAAEGVQLSTKMVYGTNNCLLQVYTDITRNVVIVVSVIDNLIKGASGQAIQNCNIMFGLPEHHGLSKIALYP